MMGLSKESESISDFATRGIGREPFIELPAIMEPLFIAFRLAAANLKLLPNVATLPEPPYMIGAIPLSHA